jgi:HPt (histidine-containing phosphotransfer) domain-containing protein
LYDEARAGSAGRGPAVDVTALGVLLLGVLVVLLAALLRLGNRGSGPSAAAGDRRQSAGRAPPAASPTALPARDLDEALRLTGGSLDIANALLEQMLAELPAQTEGLTTAVACDDWEAAREIALGMRSGSAVCAVPALHAAIRRLQAATRNEDPASIAAVLAEIDAERRRLVTPERRRLTAPRLAGASLCRG